MYLFYQKVGGATKWETALAQDREKLVKQGVEFITVMNVSDSLDTELKAEDLVKLRYAAPLGFYIDFDSSDLNESLNQARVLIHKLEDEYEADMTQSRLYFTGGRGCHIEIPLECFLAKIPNNGITQLPAIFKEMALTLFVDTMDLRIYNGRKTRQWRVPNVQRSNGLYKVQVSYDEFMKATADDYTTLCSAPRDALPLSPPETNSKLSYLYASCKDRVDKMVRGRSKTKDQVEALKKFSGEWPESLKPLLMGEGVNPYLGWNQIAMQLACLAIALGKSEEALLTDARGLIDNHEGDSKRYASPHKRERELRNQYRYLDGNPGYEFRLAGAISLYGDKSKARDLRSGDSSDDFDDFDAEIIFYSSKDEGGKDEGDKRERLARNVKWNKQGIFVLEEDQWSLRSHFGIANPTALFDIEQEKFVGYQIEVFADGVSKGEHLIGSHVCTSKPVLNNFTTSWGCSVQMNDQQVSVLTDYLRLRTSANKAQVFTTTREGVDFIVPHSEAAGEKPQFVFVTNDKVLVPADSNMKFKFSGVRGFPTAFGTDLLDAPSITETPELTERVGNFIEHLLEVNTEENVGKALGWFVACFMAQGIRRRYAQFPLLHVYGPMSSGKSKTVELFNQMHYYLSPPKKLAASGQTLLPLLVTIAQAGSMPVILEEYKPREMSKTTLDILRNLLRVDYTGESFDRGGIDKAGGSIKIDSFSIRGPIAFLSEAIEDQPAIVDRSVIMSLTPQGRKGRTHHYLTCFEDKELLGVIGAHLARQVIRRNDYESLNLIAEYDKQLRDKVGEGADNVNRPIFNRAVVLFGIRMFQLEMAEIFGTRFDVKLNSIQAGFLNNIDSLQVATETEIGKVLDILARLTRNSHVDYRLDPRYDYQVDGDVISLKIKPVFAKYVRYQRSLRLEIGFDSDHAFIKALDNYPGTVTKLASAERIRRNPWEHIYGISQQTMLNDGCEPFEGYEQ
jgi:hypothetical protein